MKLVKSDWRNSLTDEAVTDIMRITLHSANIKEYNPDPAVHLWNTASILGRRPNQKTWRKRKEINQQSHDPDDSDTGTLSDSGSDDEITLTNRDRLRVMPASVFSDDDDVAANAMFHSDSEESSFEGFSF